MSQSPLPAEIRLRTLRLALRAPQMSDAPAITALLSDWEVVKMLARVPHPYRAGDARDWLAGEPDRRAAGTGCVFAITRADDATDSCIGVIGLDWRDDGAINLGFWLGRPYWGQGLMTEAAGAVLDFAFDADGLDLKRIHSGFLRENEGSRRVHEKLGFAVIGEGRIYCMARSEDVAHIDVALSRHEWRAPPAPTFQPAAL